MTHNERVAAYNDAVAALVQGLKSDLLGKRVRCTAYGLDFIGRVVRINPAKSQTGGYSVSVDAEDPATLKLAGCTCHPSFVTTIEETP